MINSEKEIHSDNECYKESKLDSVEKFNILSFARLERGKFNCHSCYLKFDTKFLLNLHRVTQCKFLPYACGKCDLRFNRISNLEQHCTIHQCSNSIENANMPNSDSDPEPKSDDVKPFMCPFCDRCFEEKAKLNRHKRSHNDMKAYRCAKCHLAFFWKSNYSQHLSSTRCGKKKEHQCEICERAFARKYSLNRHMNCHTKKGIVNVSKKDRISPKKSRRSSSHAEEVDNNLQTEQGTDAVSVQINSSTTSSPQCNQAGNSVSNKSSEVSPAKVVNRSTIKRPRKVQPFKTYTELNLIDDYVEKDISDDPSKQQDVFQILDNELSLPRLSSCKEKDAADQKLDKEVVPEVSERALRRSRSLPLLRPVGDWVGKLQPGKEKLLTKKVEESLSFDFKQYLLSVDVSKRQPNSDCKEKNSASDPEQSLYSTPEFYDLTEDLEEKPARDTKSVKKKTNRAALRKYKCDVCCLRFRWKCDLLRHRRTHNANKPFQCDKCDLGFNWKSNLTRHQRRVHDGELSYECNKCGRGFVKQYHLSRHRNGYCRKTSSRNSSRTSSLGSDSGARPTQDEITFADNLDLIVKQEDIDTNANQDVERRQVLDKDINIVYLHTCDQNGSYYKGEDCETGRSSGKQSAKMGDSLQVDLPKRKSENGKNNPETSVQFECTRCDRVFERKTCYVQHERSHERMPFHCKSCGRSFARKSVLIRHEQEHMSEKIFRCEICYVNFRQKAQLLQHISIHSENKIYECEICRKSFSRKSVLVRHRYIHKGEKLYKCYGCDLVFSDKSVLVKHREIHDGFKTFKCSNCRVEFTLLLNEERFGEVAEASDKQLPILCNDCNSAISAGDDQEFDDVNIYADRYNTRLSEKRNSACLKTEPGDHYNSRSEDELLTDSRISEHSSEIESDRGQGKTANVKLRRRKKIKKIRIGDVSEEYKRIVQFGLSPNPDEADFGSGCDFKPKIQSVQSFDLFEDIGSNDPSHCTRSDVVKDNVSETEKCVAEDSKNSFDVQRSNSKPDCLDENRVTVQGIQFEGSPRVIMDFQSEESLDGPDLVNIKQYEVRIKSKGTPKSDGCKPNEDKPMRAKDTQRQKNLSKKDQDSLDELEISEILEKLHLRNNRAKSDFQGKDYENIQNLDEGSDKKNIGSNKNNSEGSLVENASKTDDKEMSLTSVDIQRQSDLDQELGVDEKDKSVTAEALDRESIDAPETTDYNNTKDNYPLIEEGKSDNIFNNHASCIDATAQETAKFSCLHSDKPTQRVEDEAKGTSTENKVNDDPESLPNQEEASVTTEALSMDYIENSKEPNQKSPLLQKLDTEDKPKIQLDQNLLERIRSVVIKNLKANLSKQETFRSKLSTGVDECLQIYRSSSKDSAEDQPNIQNEECSQHVRSDDNAFQVNHHIQMNNQIGKSVIEGNDYQEEELQNIPGTTDVVNPFQNQQPDESSLVDHTGFYEPIRNYQIKAMNSSTISEFLPQEPRDQGEHMNPNAVLVQEFQLDYAESRELTQKIHVSFDEATRDEHEHHTPTIERSYQCVLQDQTAHNDQDLYRNNAVCCEVGTDITYALCNLAQSDDNQTELNATENPFQSLHYTNHFNGVHVNNASHPYDVHNSPSREFTNHVRPHTLRELNAYQPNTLSFGNNIPNERRLNSTLSASFDAEARFQVHYEVQEPERLQYVQYEPHVPSLKHAAPYGFPAPKSMSPPQYTPQAPVVYEKRWTDTFLPEAQSFSDLYHLQSGLNPIRYSNFSVTEAGRNSSFSRNSDTHCNLGFPSYDITEKSSYGHTEETFANLGMTSSGRCQSEFASVRSDRVYSHLDLVNRRDIPSELLVPVTYREMYVNPVSRSSALRYSVPKPYPIPYIGGYVIPSQQELHVNRPHIPYEYHYSHPMYHKVMSQQPTVHYHEVQAYDSGDRSTTHEPPHANQDVYQGHLIDNNPSIESDQIEQDHEPKSAKKPRRKYTRRPKANDGPKAKSKSRPTSSRARGKKSNLEEERPKSENFSEKNNTAVSVPTIERPRSENIDYRSLNSTGLVKGRSQRERPGKSKAQSTIVHQQDRSMFDLEQKAEFEQACHTAAQDFNVSDDLFCCDQCNRVFLRKNDLLQHLLNEHQRNPFTRDSFSS